MHALEQGRGDGSQLNSSKHKQCTILTMLQVLSEEGRIFLYHNFLTDEGEE